MASPGLVELPAGLRAFTGRPEDWSSWLDRLPRLVADLVEDWHLTVDGPPTHGFCALVLPVRTDDGLRAVLKVSWPHVEAEHEHLALSALRGDGAVLLLRADPSRHAMLLERLQPRNLTTVPDREACEIVAGLYRRLHVPALPQLRSLAEYVDRSADELRALPRGAPLPRRLVEQSVSCVRDLTADSASSGVMVHGDLHYENVLGGERQPWLAIDPKPMSGDPHYEVAPMLWNRWEDHVVSGDVRRSLRRRFHALVDAAGLDEDRARDWVVVRGMLNAVWCLTASAGELDGTGREWITRSVTIAKAVQD